MATGAYKHRVRGRRRAKWARGRGFGSKKLNVRITITRAGSVDRMFYNVEACFRPGPIASVEPGDPRAWRPMYLNKRRVRIQSDRCAKVVGVYSPTVGVKRVLAALAKKKL